MRYMKVQTSCVGEAKFHICYKNVNFVSHIRSDGVERFINPHREFRLASLQTKVRVIRCDECGR